MATQRLGTAQLMFVHAGPVIVVDTLLTVAGAGPEAMPATFVLALDPSVMARNRRRRMLSYWAAIGAVCTIEVTPIDDKPYATFVLGDKRVTFPLAGCVSRPRLVIAAS